MISMRLLSVVSLCASAAVAQVPKLKGFQTVDGQGHFAVPERSVDYRWDSGRTVQVPKGQWDAEAMPFSWDSSWSRIDMAKWVAPRPFAMGETEVSNREWWEFVQAGIDAATGHSPRQFDYRPDKTDGSIADLARLLDLPNPDSFESWASVWIANKGYMLFEFYGESILPDYGCWMRDFPLGFMAPFEDYYFAHPAYANYPVVGISQEQANAFCRWKTDQCRSQLEKFARKTGTDGWYIGLPSEEQFVAASMFMPDGKKKLEGYAPYLPFTRNSKGAFLLNYNAFLDQKEPNNSLGSDGALITTPVYSYWPNQHGLYNLHGNVAEWTRSVDIESGLCLVKGGCYMDPAPCVWALSRTALPANRRDSRVGFRMAVLQSGE